MRRPSKSSSQKLPADSQRLATFAQAIVQAASRVEERAWERNLDTLLQKLLKNGHQDTIDAALDHLFNVESGAYDALMESAEAAGESCIVELDGVRYDALLIAAPILAWTRFSIASGPIAADMVMTLAAHLNAHLLAPGTRLAITPTLFSIDQLPRSHAETLAATQRMAQAALKGSPLRPLVNPPQTAPFLADTRYLLAVVVAAVGEPLFRWQASMNLAERDDALTQWRTQAMPSIVRLLPGCGVELLLPEAYFLACREADKQIRPASIRAAVHYLTHTLSVEPSGLRAIIGGFGDEPVDDRVDEYRIGFSLGQEPDILYGIVWPLYGPEDEEQPGDASPATLIDSAATAPGKNKSSINEIFSLLKEGGVVDIVRHSERFPMEFCEDCGAPLFPDPDGELVHAEMPENVPQGTGHFH
jgi:Protein of unknown function (DUF2863)